MSNAPNSFVRDALEKLLRDNGFDLEPAEVGNWLMGRSSGTPMNAWLTQEQITGPIFFALSDHDVAAAMNLQLNLKLPDLPPGILSVAEAIDRESMNLILRRAFQLSRALPSTPLHDFEARTKNMPVTTEAERFVIQRIGQERFREALMDFWDGRCALSGLNISELLRASHIKPWKDSTNEERLNPYNGLLLAVHLDALFDRGFISFSDEGSMLLSTSITEEQIAILGIANNFSVKLRLVSDHKPFLEWHRTRVLKK